MHGSMFMHDLILLVANTGQAAGEAAGEVANKPVARDAASKLTQALPWILLIILGGVVLFVLGFWVKRQFLGGPERTVDEEAGGFSLSYLRKMHEAGELSDEEFEKTRERIVSRAQRKIAEEAETVDDRAAIRPGQTKSKDVDLIRDAE